MNRLMAPAGLAAAALFLLMAGPGLAQMSPETKSQARVLLQPCLPDYHKLCSSVPKGNGQILQCLIDHKDQLSAACKQGLIKAQALTAKPNSPQ